MTSRTIFSQENKQSIYDSFNSFIFSDDKSVFNKMMMRHELYSKVKHLHGDIVECGVFKGSGMATWCKLLQMYEPNSIKKVIGFDQFGSKFVSSISDDIDREMMSQVFSRDPNLSDDELSANAVHDRLIGANIPSNKFELIIGDVQDTTSDYVKKHPGLLISLLYLDLDLYLPTYYSLDRLYDLVVPGGIIVFDEYAYSVWSETGAVNDFLKNRKELLINTNIAAPTAYIIKQ